jgi:DNA repair exonuclease SbcCD ATPase subunit
MTSDIEIRNLLARMRLEPNYHPHELEFQLFKACNDQKNANEELRRQISSYSGKYHANLEHWMGECSRLEREVAELRETKKQVQERDKLRGDLRIMELRFAAPIVCLCGSVRFKDEYIMQTERFTLEGNIVLSVGLYMPTPAQELHPDVKVKLDWLHKRKIDLCDFVFVINPGNYIGKSTRSEIDYALSLGRPVKYLESHEEVKQ